MSLTNSVKTLIVYLMSTRFKGFGDDSFKRRSVIPPGESFKGLSRKKLERVVGRDDGSPINQVVNELKKVDTDAPTAKLNKTSISDNNGGRIKLNDGTGSNGKNIK